MKKFTILVLVCVIASFVMADELEKLQDGHKKAMQFYGRSDVMAKGKMFFMRANNQMVSVFKTENIATAYTEQGDRKIYWEWKPIPGGIEIYIKVEILGHVFEKTITILFNKGEFVVKQSGDVKGFDWQACLGKCGDKILPCIKCVQDPTNWDCWIDCGFSAAMCVITKCL